jgi:hypothetical protein
MRSIAFATVCLLGGCATAPLPIHQESTLLSEVATNYRAIYPSQDDPDPVDDAGLLRPRFGLPAIVQAGAPFAIELFERGAGGQLAAALVQPGLSDADARRCLGGATVAGCFPLTLTAGESNAVGADHKLTLSARPAVPPPPGGYDLYLGSSCDAPTRAPRAVWLRAEDPATLPEVRVAHLTDIHVGKHRSELEAHLRQVVDEVNQLAPDLVVITGDIVNQGTDSSLAPRARQLLLGLQAPVAVVIGNHDIGFRSFIGAHYGVGWTNFARIFHPFLEFELALGGYRFIGFDSGPSTLSPRILTRGIAPATLDYLRQALVDAGRRGDRGVVLFSHAPSRAVLSGERTPSANLGAFGHMRAGSAAFERMLLDAAERGERVLHLAGHTHWCDLFEAQAHRGGLEFARWPDGSAADGLMPIHAKAALINTQAATHSGTQLKASAHGYGFTFLLLGDGDPQVAFHRHDSAAAAAPSSAIATPAAPAQRGSKAL